jgi:NAD(P)H-hydrate epimerase
MLPPIPRDANKFSRGSLLVLGGSKRFPGAAILAALAAARTGAGYVTLAVPEPVVAVAQAHLLTIPVLGAPADDASGSFAADAFAGIRSLVEHCDAIVLGPGLSLSEASIAFVQSVLDVLALTETPLLIDADGLNALVALGQGGQGSGPIPVGAAFMPGLTTACVLTPHAGELGRLLGAFGCETAGALAHTLAAVVVAKGPKTRVVAADGRVVTNGRGTPALATAGTGDVLSGIIGSLLAQGLAPFDAATLGVELHARAGRWAERELGTRSVIASDLVDVLPWVLKEYEACTA